MLLPKNGAIHSEHLFICLQSRDTTSSLGDKSKLINPAAPNLATDLDHTFVLLIADAPGRHD
jgi:hypothetical protein